MLAHWAAKAPSIATGRLKPLRLFSTLQCERLVSSVMQNSGTFRGFSETINTDDYELSSQWITRQLYRTTRTSAQSRRLKLGKSGLYVCDHSI
jgi:hypothetical protein